MATFSCRDISRSSALARTAGGSVMFIHVGASAETALENSSSTQAEAKIRMRPIVCDNETSAALQQPPLYSLLNWKRATLPPEVEESQRQRRHTHIPLLRRRSPRCDVYYGNVSVLFWWTQT